MTLDEADLGQHTLYVKANDGTAVSPVQELTITVTGENDNAPVAIIPTSIGLSPTLRLSRSLPMPRSRMPMVIF